MRRRLLFVSPQFLFPLDAGGKIRTTNILRHLNGKAFDVTLLSPADPGGPERWRREIDSVCSAYRSWPDSTSGLGGKLRRVASVLAPEPVTVAVGRSADGSILVRQELAGGYDVAVFDYLHAAVLMPPDCATPSICFTHNVETEILARHAKVELNPILRWLWRRQHAKMERFERTALRRFDSVIAVSERDAQQFRDRFALPRVAAIPTGVDLDYFRFAPPAQTLSEAPTVAFTGSMDWRPNVDGIGWFLAEIWPRVVAAVPAARLVVVGKNAPEGLVASARARGLSVEFTGFVDDVRPHVRGADAYVIPLRIGGGTRIKAYEAMAMGLPIVSTAVGIEGLPVEAGKHFLAAEDAETFAAKVVQLIQRPDRRAAIASEARRLIEANFGAEKVAAVFERLCLDACSGATYSPPANTKA